MKAGPTRLPANLEWVQPLLPLVASRIAVLSPSADAPEGRDIDVAAEEIEHRWPLRAQAPTRVVRYTAYDNGRGAMWTVEQDGEVTTIDALDDPRGEGAYGFPTGRALTGDELFAPDSARQEYRAAKSARKAARGIGPELVDYVRLLPRRLVRPNGVQLHLVGPDGSGKSTVGDQLEAACAGLFLRVRRDHWRPGVLPRPGLAFRTPPLDQAKPHARQPHGRIASLALLGYYWLDFALGGWLAQRWALMRSGLVIVDRGWVDLEIDPTRYRLDVPRTLVRALGRLLPRPDVTVLLGLPGHVAAERKGELAPEEADRQVTAWHALLSPTRSVVLDATRPPDEVLRAVRAAIVDVLERRTIQRIGAWRAVPARDPRVWLTPARESLAVHPSSGARARRSRIALEALARAKALWLLPGRTPPPRAVRELLAPLVGRGESYAVARSTLAGRFTAVLLDRRGNATAFAKLSTGPNDGDALAREANALRKVAGRLAPEARVPQLLHEEEGAILVEFFAAAVRRAPGQLPDSVARALGRLWRETRLVHGDFAPWNLLDAADGPVVVDWEHAHEGTPCADVLHWYIQAAAYLDGPSAAEIAAGLDGHGPIGSAVRAYLDGAAIDLTPDLRARLAAELEQRCRWLQEVLDSDFVPHGRAGTTSELERHRALLATLVSPSR